MTQLSGYAGQQLRVALDTGKIATEDLDPAAIEKYLGGVGYAAKLLHDELDGDVDPLGPANKLIFATGPLSRYEVPGGGSIEVCFKSANGTWGEARCGGNIGPDLKRAGFDFVIFEGQSAKPVYLVIRDGEAELRPAERLLGLPVSEKIKVIGEELSDSDINVMCIGVGGENKVRFASIMYGGRSAGRTGAGAVMGAKNLIALAVKGTAPQPAPADAGAFKAACREAMTVVRHSEAAPAFSADGTMGDMPGNDEAGDWPTKNWQSNSWGNGQELFDAFRANNLASTCRCYRGCPISCGRIAKVDDGQYKTPEHEGGEYESISTFTAFVMNDDMDAAVHSTYLCNEYGIDTISAGAVIAFAMECFENGLITLDDTGGLSLDWGNAAALGELVKRIATREGIGDLLAEGVKVAAAKLGRGAEKFAIHGKGLEGPAHDPRSGKALAVTYGTANRGMCHIHPLEGMAYDSGKMDWGLTKHGLPDPEAVDRWEEKGKGKAVKTLQDGLILPDVVGTCKFMMYADVTVDHYAAMLSGLTGREITGADMLRVGERTTNIQRLFNIKAGLTPADDAIPERVKQRPAFGKYADEDRCAIADFDAMLAEYYQARGWDPKTGKPTEEKLADL